jgi:hypothetical protein
VITEGLLDMALDLLDLVFGLLPVAEGELAMPDVTPVFSAIAAFDAVGLPVTEMFTVAAALLSTTLAMWVYRLASKLLSHIPLFGGSG